MGGNYDALFLECPSTSLGFIYKSLGCFHSLQQENDPFAAPTVPTLTPAGFVRWQTVQLLLNPDDQVRYLQKAVKRLEIINGGPGGPFPKILPAECLPRTPDPKMTKWHERVGDRLRIESEAQAARSAPPTARNPSFRPADLESVTDLSVDSHSMVDASEYFQASSTSPKRPVYTKAVPVPATNGRFHNADPGRRGSSYTSRSPDYADGPAPTYGRYSRRSPRNPEPAAVEPASSSSDSRSPPRQHQYGRTRLSIRLSDAKDRSPRSYSATRSPGSQDPVSPLKDELGRRHSSHLLANYGRRDSMPPPPQPVAASQASQTLSPPFFVSQKGRNSNQFSPTGPTAPPGGRQAASALSPQNQPYARPPRNTVNYGSGPIDSWRSKLNAYVNGSNPGPPAPTLPVGGRRRSQSGGLESSGREPLTEGVRFVEGVGGLDDRRSGGQGYDRKDGSEGERNSKSRRRRDSEREWESELEDRRPERLYGRRERRSGEVGEV